MWSMEELRAMYLDDPMYKYVVIYGTGVALFSLFLFGLPMTALAVWDPEWAQKYKIQKERTGAMSRAMIVPCLKNIAVNYLVSVIVVNLSWPVLRLLLAKHDAPEPSWLRLVLSVAFCAVVEDFLFYWMHYGLHRHFYWLHKWHHEHKTPIALSGGYMHPVEQQLILLNIMLPLILLQAHWITWLVWIFFRNWETAEEHSGYDFPFNPTRLLPFYDGAGYHEYHHAKFDGNYAAVFPIWDKLFGTVAVGYNDYMNKRFAAAAEAAPAATSNKQD